MNMSTVTLDSVWASAQLLSRRDRSILKRRLSNSIESKDKKERNAYREPTEGESMVKESVVKALNECQEAERSGKPLKNAWTLLEEMEQW